MSFRTRGSHTRTVSSSLADTTLRLGRVFLGGFLHFGAFRYQDLRTRIMIFRQVSSRIFVFRAHRIESVVHSVLLHLCALSCFSISARFIMATVRSAQFSLDGQNIVSASSDKTVRVWSAATGECVQTLAGHSSWVFSAQFSPDGQNIVSASWDRTVRVWRAATGECVQTLAGHSRGVNSAQFSPAGRS
eukprot:COSAG01_NODE_31786_length_591_cov_1.510163_1_plen_188_part_10